MPITYSKLWLVRWSDLDLVLYYYPSVSFFFWWNTLLYLIVMLLVIIISGQYCTIFIASFRYFVLLEIYMFVSELWDPTNFMNIWNSIGSFSLLGSKACLVVLYITVASLFIIFLSIRQNVYIIFYVKNKLERVCLYKIMEWKSIIINVNNY